MKIGSLFSGIGGLELGLEWAGVGETVWQVEQDEYCLRVLERHWPYATRYDDVRTVGAHNLESVDVICGGFPCQDISVAGRGAGLLSGARSGLWFAFERVVRELAPQWVVVENVAAIEGARHRDGLNAVLGGLRSLGYRGERAVVSAADVGLRQRRDRWFLLAYAECSGPSRHLKDDALPVGPKSPHTELRYRAADARMALDGDRGRLRSPDGVSVAMERRRVRALGNAVVPQVAEVVGRRLLQIDAERRGVAA